MPLTTVIGSYKSGKTALLDDVFKHSKHLTYIRQGHKVRPDIKVCEIPGFDPSELPFWDLYKSSGMADTVMVGGVLAGEYIPGLTGGQHKLLLLEMLYQHTLPQSKLSIALDEPFEMVSDQDGSLSFVIDRLNRMRERHHLLISTCDHIETLAELADINLGLTPFQPHMVTVNNREYVDREHAILALSVFDQRAKHHIDDDDNNNDSHGQEDISPEYHEYDDVQPAAEPEPIEYEPEPEYIRL